MKAAKFVFALTVHALAVATFATFLLSQSAIANSELDVKTTATDLTTSASYTQGTTPTTTSDITFTSSIYGATTFTANTALSIGTLNDLDATQSLIITNNGAANDLLTLNGGTDSVSGSTAGDLIFLASGANLTIQNGSKNLGLVLAASGNFDVGSSATLTINSIISGANGFTKTGTGTLVLGGANTFTGTLTVQAGTLSIANINNSASNGALGNSATAVVLGGSGTTGTLEFTGANDSSTRKFTMATGGTGVFQVDTAATTLTLSGVIDGSGDLTKSGAGTLLLSGANTSFSGNVAVDAGILQMGSTTALNSSNVVSVAAGATFDLNAQNETIAGLDGGTGTVTNSGGAKTLTLDGSGTYSFAGVITSHNFIDTRIVKSGSGTQTLTGTNLYTGTTMVTGGKLFVNGDNSAATGAVTVSNSGTVLGGSGTIGGTVSVGSGANLSPGATGAGSTAVLHTGALTLSSGSFFNVDLNNTTVGTGYDQVSVMGTVSITGSNLVVTAANSLVVGQKFFILANDLADAITGTFVQGSSVTATNGDVFSISYVADFAGGTSTGGNDILLTVTTAIPEPSTWVAGALAFAALAYTQRRRLSRLLERA
jgi:fibronectin-binding autotransporter adhesin